MKRTEVRAIEAEVESHKAALERLGDSGTANDFELDYQAGMISGLTLALKVARRTKAK